mgnify:CR=1 FL=1
MAEPETDPQSTPIRQTMRTTALILILLAAAMITAEWTMAPGGVASGALVSGGLVLCLSGSVLSVALLAARRRG